MKIVGYSRDGINEIAVGEAAIMKVIPHSNGLSVIPRFYDTLRATFKERWAKRLKD